MTARCFSNSCRVTGGSLPTMAAVPPEAQTHPSTPSDVPVADSGYGSLTDSGYAKVGAMGPRLTNVDDARTEYSGTTVAGTGAQRSITAVCDDIYTHVRSDTALKGYQHLQDSLPELLKAFAIRLGGDNSNALNKQIMYFIHKNHRTIVSELECRFEQDLDLQSQPPCRSTSDGMSLLDKMDMWGRQDTYIYDADPFGTGFFDGVTEDDDDELFYEPQDSVYTKVVLDSAPYQWLLAGLLKQLSLHWGAGCFNVMVNEVRRKIVKTLPPARPSKHRTPDDFHRSFRLSWQPFRARLHEEQANRRTSGKSILSEVIVLTCSSEDQIQASTVGEYCRQTWPDCGIELLSSLEKLIDSTSVCDTVPVITDKTKIHYELEASHLVVTVSGSAYSIIQCGEQLAWLGSAVQASGLEPAITSYTPSLVGSSVVSVEAKREIFRFPLVSCLYWATSRQHFDGRTIPPSFVRGYPTAIRPDGFPGLEVSYDLLLALAQGKRGYMTVVELNRERMLLEGSYATLELVKYTEGIFLWHKVDSPSLSCNCRNNLHTGDGNPWRIDLEELALQRHIISICEAQRAPAHNTTTTRTSLGRETPVGNRGSVPSDPSGQRLDGENEGSSESSLDPDMLSISNLTGDVPLSALDTEGNLAPAIDNVINRLLSEFQATTTGMPSNIDGDSTQKVSSSNAEVQIPPTSNRGFSGSSRKRSSAEHKSDVSDEDGSKNPIPKRLKLHQERQGRLLACPFWKMNPIKHRSCFSRKLDQIPRVKQHLARSHTPSFYCQRCLVIFKEEEAFERHIKCPPDQMCSVDPTAELDGLSLTQQKQLSKKSNSSLSQEQQWFAIWHIVFPGKHYPVSAYMDTGLSEDLARFREFCFARGPAILTDEIEPSLPMVTSAHSDDGARQHMLRNILSRGVAALFDQWTSGEALSRNTIPSDALHSSVTRSSRAGMEDFPSTSTVSSADSGILIDRPYVCGLSADTAEDQRNLDESWDGRQEI
ncbi:hypothetical protein AUP68_02158 [Ilyonectria robusta]